MLTRSQVFAAGVWAILATFAGCVLLVVALGVAGCAPKPEANLVLWEQPDPATAARLHASEINGSWYSVAPTGSMEPLITGGDAITVDLRFPWASIKPGMVLVYQASWQPPTAPPVVHMAAAWSGDALIMSGIANAHYENSVNGGLHLTQPNYLGRVVQIYTKRKKT